MKIKNILLAAVAAVIAFPALAQDNDYKIQVKEVDNRWFVGAGGGMNFGIDGKFEDYKNSNYGAGTSLDVYFGKFFNNWLGFRAGYQGLTISEERGDYGKDPFHYGHADLLFRVTDWFIPYIHGGYAKLNTGSPAGGIGIMMPIAITDHLSIVPDFKATALNGNAFSQGEKKFAANLGGSLGLVWKFGKKSKQEVKHPTVIVPPVVPVTPPKNIKDDSAIKDSIENAKRLRALDSLAQAERQKRIADSIDEANRHNEALKKLAESLKAKMLFDFDSAELTDEAKTNLDKVVEYLKLNESIKVEVGGHTDNLGSDEYNRDLSLRRAHSVVKYLVSKGIASSRLTPVGYGMKYPVASNDTEEGRHENRRIELKVR